MFSLPFIFLFFFLFKNDFPLFFSFIIKGKEKRACNKEVNMFYRNHKFFPSDEPNEHVRRIRQVLAIVAVVLVVLFILILDIGRYTGTLVRCVSCREIVFRWRAQECGIVFYCPRCYDSYFVDQPIYKPDPNSFQTEESN